MTDNILDITPYVAIQAAASRLLDGNWIIDDIELDRRLGELEGLIYTVRQSISDDWRCRREAAAQGPSSKPYITNLEDLA